MFSRRQIRIDERHSRFRVERVTSCPRLGGFAGLYVGVCDGCVGCVCGGCVGCEGHGGVAGF